VQLVGQYPIIRLLHGIKNENKYREKYCKNIMYCMTLDKKAIRRVFNKTIKEEFVFGATAPSEPSPPHSQRF